MTFRRLLRYFLASIPLAVIYYILLANMIYYGEDARMLKENRRRARYLDTLEQQVREADTAIKLLEAKDGKIYKSIFGTYPIEDMYHLEMGHNLDIGRTLALAKKVNEQIDSIKSNLAYLGSSSRHIPSIIPVIGCGVEAIGASVGRKVNPFIKSVVWHSGVDIASEQGTPVVCSADGIVASVSRADRSEGEVIEIDHLNGYVTRYAHLEDIVVKVGDTLSRGTRIACVGLSGKTIAPHLHYEVLFDSKKVNPVCYFFASVGPDAYSLALHKAENNGQSLD